ncbi:MAG: hypothetical protein WEA56_10200 [Balneolaceae bacterium]
MSWNQVYEWFMGLGEPYGVDPLIFGLIYIGAIPFFWLAITWLVYNIRRKRPVTGPVLMACSCAVSAYVYLIIAGENVPFWVYGVIAGIIVYAIFATLKKLNKITDEVELEEETI